MGPEVQQNSEQKQLDEPFFLFFHPKQMMFLFLLPMAEPIRRRAARWAPCATAALPFSPGMALPFQATDCCSRAQGSCGKDI